MNRWRRWAASWILLMLAPWVALTLTSGGLHNHTGLNLDPTRADSRSCASHRDEVAAPPTGTDRTLFLSFLADEPAADLLCPACLWQLTAQADSPGDTRAPRSTAVTPVARAARPSPAAMPVATADARAPPRG